ncbi:AAA family ATPase [Tunicatimonas pelagia]|uniref:AAA family ATPase n=1 Tax=Tunicatimonas pelagia TaxID=931531 RepID=UPI0026655ADB|nr:AAA family ATPase [Tunicatimonas pelagia]WKN45833.1 AAA family ATPase [Tunicatimonas pelagia]
MHITHLQLINFKRFTDLTIDLSKLATPPKLVLLIGANGSGKSSVFDAFESLSNFSKDGHSWTNTRDDSGYYQKDTSKELYIRPIIPELDPSQPSTPGNIPRTAFYGRSSLRQIPKLEKKRMSNFSLESDSDRPLRYIERDNRFENDIEILTQKILEEVFTGSDFDAKKLKERYLEPINQSLFRIFGGLDASLLELVSLKPPLGGNVADVRFKKGISEIHYDLLSSGEKEVINILLNLFVRRDTYNDTIYFIDELDLHLNTKLQYALLKEITENWIPKNCQLWTASHSFGFIEYARETDHSAVIDFDSFDFDEKHVLLPESKNSLDIFDVAVPKDTIFNLFHNKDIILCENQNDQFYNLLNLENKLFVGVADKNQVFIQVKRDKKFMGLMDRDFLVDQEITKAKRKYPNLRILEYYCFENYLYHPNNINELISDFDTEAYQQEIFKQKEDKKLKIVLEIKTVRNSYAILKESDIRDKNVDTIVESFSSQEFETYYRFFDMKAKFNKEFIASHNLSVKELVSTNWFRNRVKQLFS